MIILHDTWHLPSGLIGGAFGVALGIAMFVVIIALIIWLRKSGVFKD